MSLTIMKTPSDRFLNLPDYDFSENYETIKFHNKKINMHYVDINNDSKNVILLLHGEPTWSYLYRHMIRNLSTSGRRIIAPDLIGFGKSDKLVEKEHYTYANHLNWTAQLIGKMNLQNIVLFAQDWGSLLGLRHVATYPERFEGMVISNGGLPIGAGSTPAFDQWLMFSQKVENFDSGKIVNQGCLRDLTEGEIAAYNAPFPDESFKAGPRVFPTLVPISADQDQVKENKEAWKELQRFDKPTIALFGDNDKVFAGQEKFIIEKIPGANGLKHKNISAGHFSQEDQPEVLCEAILSIK